MGVLEPHGPHAPLRAAAADAGALYLDLVRRHHAERLTDEFRRGSCHAGQYETSLVLAAAPQLVDRETMAALPPLEVVGLILPPMSAILAQLSR